MAPSLSAAVPRGMRIARLDPDDESGVRAWYEVRASAEAVDLPMEPPLSWRQHAAGVRLDPSGIRPVVELAWSPAGPTGARVVGGYALSLPTHDNLHAGSVEVVVAPDCRRQGVGSALVRHARDRLRAEGRRLLVLETPEASPGPAFCTALGATLGMVDVRRTLDVRAIDTAEVARLLADARSHATGYSVVRWAGPVPAEHLADVSVLLAAMSDAPTDQLDWGAEAYPPERIRRIEDYTALAGDRQYTVAARHDRTGRLVALTTVFVRADHPWWSAQGDTVVLAAHRGHRLGLLVKASMLLDLPTREPEARHLLTWNAQSNGHMIAINEALGYRILDRWQEWQSS